MIEPGLSHESKWTRGCFSLLYRQDSLITVPPKASIALTREEVCPKKVLQAPLSDGFLEKAL